MFHVEVRQFPNVARAFNLTRAELQQRILAAWIAGATIEFDERKWSPEKAKLTVYDGPELRPDQIGMGRGWGNVTRSGREVTEAVLSEAVAAAVTPVDEAADWLKGELIARTRVEPISLPGALALANERHRDWRASDRLAVAERAVWELLHLGELRMLRGDDVVERGDWERVVLDWDTWRGAAAPAPMLERVS